MSSAFNLFRMAADISHILSKVILMWSIHWNRSAEVGVLIQLAMRTRLIMT
jgi:ER lumen protein retaining receptor